MSTTAGVVLALDALTALLTLSVRVADAARRINETIQKARAEGRDLTPEEMREAQLVEAQAFARWHELRVKNATIPSPTD